MYLFFTFYSGHVTLQMSLADYTQKKWKDGKIFWELLVTVPIWCIFFCNGINLFNLNHYFKNEIPNQCQQMFDKWVCSHNCNTLAECKISLACLNWQLRFCFRQNYMQNIFLIRQPHLHRLTPLFCIRCLSESTVLMLNTV